VQTLNEVYSAPSVCRRYEVWFVRLGLADGSGAWWFRYLLMNPGRGGCPGAQRGMPVQVWATWFPRDGKPQSFIQGYALNGLELSARGQDPFHFRHGSNAIEENSCRGALQVDGHTVSWDLHCRSTFRVTLSDKGWIGFSRTPHSDAIFSGQIILDGRRWADDRLAFGVQGHNCGYRHRGFWTWAHGYFPRTGGPATTLEALTYDMPFGPGLSQSGALARGPTACVPEAAGKQSRCRRVRVEFSLLLKIWPAIRSSFRWRWALPASLAVLEDQLFRLLRGDEQQLGKGVGKD
jgi:hypothetical protein